MSFRTHSNMCFKNSYIILLWMGIEWVFGISESLILTMIHMMMWTVSALHITCGVHMDLWTCPAFLTLELTHVSTRMNLTQCGLQMSLQSVLQDFLSCCEVIHDCVSDSGCSLNILKFGPRNIHLELPQMGSFFALSDMISVIFWFLASWACTDCIFLPAVWILSNCKLWRNPFRKLDLLTVQHLVCCLFWVNLRQTCGWTGWV